MAVKIRLRRVGAKKRPSYRLVVADSRSPRDGRFIDQVGTYDPLTQPATVRIDTDRVRIWLANGAQPTAAVRSLFTQEGIIGKHVAEQSEPVQNAEESSPA